MEQLNLIWRNTMDRVKSGLPTTKVYDSWLAPASPYSMDQTTREFTIFVENSLQRTMIDKKYKDMIETELYNVTGIPYRLVILIRDDMEDIKPLRPTNTSAEINPSLNPRYTFDSFIVGNSNRLAHAAAYAVAKNPANAYNPLFLYGNVGLGKTHLMHSIAHYILQNNPEAKVLYVTSETFTNELIYSIREQKTEEFRNKYRNIDILLIDDIQFIAQKDRTQEEFFHTFNTLYESNKQIIISSDRPPKEIKTLEERLRSRFEWGLIADIQPPDFETRIAILQKRAVIENINIPNDVMEFIAQNIKSNIRELEGALTRIAAYSHLMDETVTLELAQEALKTFLKNDTPAVSPDYIQETVAKFYGISAEDIKGSKKPKNIAYPRQIAMYLTREMLDLSYPQIGEIFGGRDHTTVMHAYTKISKDIEENSKLASDIETLMKRIRESE